MAQVIASTYEIIKQIGAGGGGVVYLGKHLRLNKPVAIKADRRSVLAKGEALRREVDALKNLTHSYIPQVYDYVIEDDTAYTVIDFIEGESLDKPLKRGERFAQAQVIEWARQLLEALICLHSQPPHGILHSDIKPANVMLTPQNTIRLIDFNIALALGAEGAVRVGMSRGYASPEHYGLDYSAAAETHGVEQNSPVSATTVIGAETLADASQNARTSSREAVLLDVRSDIYGIGATLYHLLSGRRPEQDAKEVTPLSPEDGVSESVALIIQKAMSPSPDDRYQTAAEMLDAFNHLHENDPRTKRHQLCIKVTVAALTALFLIGGLCSFAGLRQMQQAEAAARLLEEKAKLAAEAAEAEERAAKEAEEAARSALAALGESENALRNGDTSGAAAFALEALALDTPYAAQAQRALTDALGVYDLTDGFKSHLLLTLPSEPLKVVLSPEGTRVAAMTSGQVTAFDTESGEQLAALPADSSALADVVFAGEDVLLYAGNGALQAYDLAEKKELWTGSAATSITLSVDGSVAAAAYKDEKIATVYDTATGAVLRTVTFPEQFQRTAVNDIFADPEYSLFTLSGDGSLLAVSFPSGALRVFDLQNSEKDLTIYEESEFFRFEGGFLGQYLAYSATGNGESVFAVIDVPGVVQIGGLISESPFHVYADESGIYFSNRYTLEQIDPIQFLEMELAYTNAEITSFATSGGYTITATGDSAFSIFGPGAQLLETWEDGERCDFVQLAGPFAVVASIDAPALRILKLENHPEAQVFSYDPAYTHSEARLNRDRTTVMLFHYNRFRLYGIGGEILMEAELPDAEQVYDQQYCRRESESWLDVIYNNGLIRSYSAADGNLFSETQGEAPDETLYQEYLTDRLRIEAPLHGTPAAYDRETEELVTELEPNDYLTYVTQVGEYVVTEYMTGQGERYGLLLNGDCETLAYLPKLCDILDDGTLVFDDMAGNLRQSRIYSIQELTALAKN